MLFERNKARASSTMPSNSSRNRASAASGAKPNVSFVGGVAVAVLAGVFGLHFLSSDGSTPTSGDVVEMSVLEQSARDVFNGLDTENQWQTLLRHHRAVHGRTASANDVLLNLTKTFTILHPIDMTNEIQCTQNLANWHRDYEKLLKLTHTHGSVGFDMAWWSISGGLLVSSASHDLCNLSDDVLRK